MNDHHRHWHIIYPNFDTPSPYHGRLFAYMHQQMLARYDAERLAAGLGLVQSFGPDEWKKTVPSAPLPDWIASIYTPQTGRNLVARPDGTGPADFIPPAALDAHVAAQKSADDRIAAGDFAGANGLEDLSIFAEAANLNDQSTDGGIHNDGHGLLGSFGGSGAGLMTTTATAVSDPVFFRWHRRVDDFFYAWQEKQSPNDFSQSPPATIKSSGLLIVPRAASANPDVENWQQFGEQHFGGTHWNDPPGAPAVTELRTHMVQDTLREPGVKALEILDDWVWFIRAQRGVNRPVNVTVRIFIVPAERAANRRMWIEMDKFKVVLDQPQTVVARPAWHSAVIRAKPADPASLPETLSKFPNNPNPHDPTTYCDCGLPYRLFLPRGTAAGMPFRLFVMLTDGDADQLDPDRECGSISYCGKLAGNTWTYPDKQEMGYPFSRPFAGGASDPIAAFIAAAPNAATTDFTIKAT